MFNIKKTPKLTVYKEIQKKKTKWSFSIFNSQNKLEKKKNKFVIKCLNNNKKKKQRCQLKKKV